MASTALTMGGLNVGRASFGGIEVTQSGNGMANNVDDVTVKLTCSEESTLEVISATPKEIKFVVPPFVSGTESCLVKTIINENEKLNALTYDTSKTPQISIAHSSGFEYQITKEVLDTIVYEKVDFVLLDENNQETSSVYSMSLTSANSVTFTVQPEGGYLPAGRFNVKAHSANYGFAQTTSSEQVTVDTDWSN